MPRLIVIKGADEGKQFELTGDRSASAATSSNASGCTTPRSPAARRVSPLAGGRLSASSTSAAPTAPSSTTSPSRTRCCSRAIRSDRPDVCSSSAPAAAKRRRGRRRPGRAHQHDHPPGRGAVLGHRQDHRRDRGQPHPRPARAGGHALAQDRPGQPGHHVRDQPGDQPHPRPAISCSTASWS